VGTFWGISNHVDLGGWGGKKFASRWTRLGSRVVYMAESPPGALLEVLVHLQFEEGELPETYQLLEISVPENLAVDKLDPPGDGRWKEQPELTQQLGDTWLQSRRTPLAQVPSAIVPHTWNFLLNPEHPDAEKLKIASSTRERFDNRLFRFGAS
jgi:RES domain-containing protein